MASRILLADDSITIQKVVNRAFADEGIDVVAVSNGDHAERQLAEVNPDLVLADIFMPGKNGYELCEFIKQSPQFRHIPVVLLVGAFEPFDQAEARRVRADDHLTKPFEFRTLVDTVRRLISQAGQSRTGPLPQTPQPEERAEGSPARPTNPMAAPGFTPPPFKIDLAAMSDPIEQAAPADDAPESISFNESAPLDLDDEPYESGGAATAGEFEMVVGRQGEDRYEIDSDMWVGRTDELASLPDQEQAAVSFDAPDVSHLENVEVASGPAEEAPISFSAGPLEAQDGAQGSNVPSRFGYDAEELILDFEKTAPPYRPEVADEIPFDMEAAPLIDVEVGEAGAGADAGPLEDEPLEDEGDSFKTRMLEPPPSYRPSWDDGPGGATARHDHYDHSDYGRLSQSGEASHMRMEAAEVSAVLTVDDPLGDVLMDESAGRAYESQPVMESTAAESDFDLTGGMFAIEFIPDQEAARTERPVTPPVEEYGAGESAEQSFEILGSAPAPEPAAEPEPINLLPGEEQPSAEQASEATAQEAVGAGAFDFQVAPEGESGEQHGSAEIETISPEHAPRMDEEFTAAAMWSEPETQFAAIDIEAVAVEETGAPAEARADETGFDLPPAPAEAEAEAVEQAAPAMQADVVEAPEAEASAPEITAPVESVEASEPPAATAQVSPEVIEQIVRRVIAEMTDSVVREIAWEVVPDCIERVVERLTREGVSRRM